MPKPVSAPCWKRAPPKTDAVRVNQAATLAPSRGLAQNLVLFQLPGLSTLRSCQTATSVQSGFVFCRIRLLVPARRRKRPPRYAFGLLPPKGELFVLGRPGDGKGPLATPSACCPQGGAFRLGVARRRKGPPRYAFGLLPPRGSFSSWGGPTTERAPSLRLRLAAPRGGAFCLGAARRRKRPPRYAFGLLPPKGELFVLGRPDDGKGPLATPSACCPPRGGFLSWDGPATEKAPSLRLRLAAPRGGAFCLGAARRQKKGLCMALYPKRASPVLAQ